MAFTRFSTNVQNITALPNKVTGQSSTLKQTFDKAGVDIKTALNALMTELEATASASSLGATSTTTVSTTIQGIISAFDTAIAARYTSTQTDTAISSATNNLVTSITFEPTTGVFTITKKDGTTTTIDTAIEKVPASFTLIESGGSYYLRITNLDGTYTQTDVTSLMNIYNFNNSDTIAFTKTTVGNVHTMSASIRNNSITMEMLGLSALTSIQGYVHQASDYATNAGTSATNANNSATAARSWAEGGTNTRTGEDTDNAKYYAIQAGLSAFVAGNSATAASGSATTASDHATTAGTKAGEASASATNASTSATTATNKATLSESWAVGGTGTRSGEDTNNAKYWSEQAQAAAQGGILNTTNTTAQATSANESLTGTVNLHKVSKTGSYNDLNDKLVFDTAPTSGSGNPVSSGGVYTALSGKQENLVSGTNIKTINSTSLLGSGNITIEGVTDHANLNHLDYASSGHTGFAPTSHTQAASTITAGTLAGKVQANATAMATLGNAQVRDIYAGTSDMTAGTTSLATGSIYVMYEA